VAFTEGTDGDVMLMDRAIELFDDLAGTTKAEDPKAKANKMIECMLIWVECDVILKFGGKGRFCGGEVSGQAKYI
jgi:hypothetical protein